jgi:hypothetical protein
MKQIPVATGFIALVDDCDYERAAQHKWSACVRSNTIYASTKIRISKGKRVSVLLHRFIMGVTDRSVQIDHRKGDGLNCQRHNLRIASPQQNNMNRAPRSVTSRFKGVGLKDGKYWRASIKFNGKSSHLGYFGTEEDAARAYDSAATEKFGEFAFLNFPPTPEEAVLLLKSETVGSGNGTATPVSL